VKHIVVVNATTKIHTVTMSNEPSPDTIVAWTRLFRGYKLLLEQTESDLKEAKLPQLSWYDVLWEVQSAPDHRIRQYELGQRVLLPKYNLSRLLDRLQKEGLLQREACPEDKRGAIIALTAKGRGLLKRMWKSYSGTILERFECRLSRTEINTFSKILEKLVD